MANADTTGPRTGQKTDHGRANPSDIMRLLMRWPWLRCRPSAATPRARPARPRRARLNDGTADPTLATPELSGVQPIFKLGYVIADFVNPHSLTAFTEARKDRRLFMSVGLTFQSLKNVIGFAPTIALRFEDSNSNIGAFAFTRWQPEIECSILAFSF
jgi:hypothetical protein